MRPSKRIAAVTLALLAAAQLAGCNSDDKPSANQNPPGDTSGGGSGTGGGGTGGGDTGGGDTEGGGTGGGDTGGGDTGGGDTGGGDTGGDGDTAGDTGGDIGGTPGAMAEGVFVDAPVAGLSYRTSSDITGVTDLEGRYDYREGDTVTFSIGGLQLGTVIAQGVVTPKTVAQAVTTNNSANTETVAVNLLVLLQSLDVDGDPDNGITFTEAIRSAVVANAIDITASEGAFTTSMTNLVATVNASPGVEVTLAPVTREAAVEHFTNHAPAALSATYVLANASFEPITQKPVTLTIFRNGRYLLGGHYDRSDCNLESGRTAKTALSFSDANGNGVEHGRYTWDPLSNEFSIAQMILETDGYCGLNEPDTQSTNDITVLEPDAKGLVFKDSDGAVVYRFARLPRDSETLAGSWLQPTSLLINQPFVFTFFPSSDDGLNGRYLMVDASFPDPAVDTSPGIEEGCYSIDAQKHATIQLNASLCADAIDTTETAGASNTDDLQVYIDENERLVIADGEDLTGFTRLPARQVTEESLAGSWIVQGDPNIALSAQPQLAMLTVFEKGRFVFGTQENNAECVPVGYEASELDDQGNGVEYGTLSLTDVPGLVVPTSVSIDSNGECGLYHHGKTDDGGAPFKQTYLVAPSKDGNALVVWPNDDEDPAGIVFKRVPSESSKVTGAWLWDEGDAGFAVVAYLQGGVMFETSIIEGAIGLLRESFTDDGATLISHAAGYEYCVDTENDQSDCEGTPGEGYEESYTIEGNTMTFIDEEEGEEYILNRIP